MGRRAVPASMRAVPRVALLALAVGLVLADSSVVTLGLPAVLGDFDASPEGTSWVLTGYNLALAIAALPAAMLIRARGDAAMIARVGLVVFAFASGICALAPSLGVLIAARCLQGLGGAAVACAALPLLRDALGRPRGAAVWGAASAIGAALGPAAGGILTDLFSWEAIFAVQVPIALGCLLATVRPAPGRLDLEAGPQRLWGEHAEPDAERFARPEPRWQRGAGVRVEPTPAPAAEPEPPPAPVAAETPPEARSLLALAFLGAGLTAALFLLVLLLIAGWRREPITAALAVTVMPLAALLSSRIHPHAEARVRGAAGAVLVAGGLAALGLLPEATLAWTVAPQVLIGIGLGLSLGPLTEAALHDRHPLVIHGGWTIAARHAGVVAALALLTPIFTADLEDADDRAKASVVAHVLDTPIAATTKLALGLELAQRLDAADGEVPDIDPAFDAAQPSPEDAPAYARLKDAVEEELDRAATGAFERSFFVGAALALLAVVPLALPRPEASPA